MPKISKVNQKYIIQKNLFFGWGVEDIAIMNGNPIEDVRSEVRRLRDAGELKTVLGVDT